MEELMRLPQDKALEEMRYIQKWLPLQRSIAIISIVTLNFQDFINHPQTQYLVAKVITN